MQLPDDLPSLETPLEMLVACHGRVRKFCDTLQKLSKHLAAHGNTLDAQTAAANVLRYFEVAAPLHHADEEEDLFPALLKASEDRMDASELRHAIQKLTHEHPQLDTMWRQLKPRLQKVQAGDEAHLGDDGLVEQFAHHYALHAQEEETQVYPWAERLLTEKQLAKISASMIKRRQHKK